MEYKQQSTRATGRQISWQSKRKDGERDRGGKRGVLLLTTGVGAFFLSNSEGFIFGPQKRNAEQSGLTTIKVMLTNNPRRDWEGLTAERDEAGEREGREKCHRRTKS